MLLFRDAKISVLCPLQEVAGFKELEPYNMCIPSLNKDGVRGESYLTLSVVWCKSLCHCIILLLVVNIGGVNIKVLAILVSFWGTVAEMWMFLSIWADMILTTVIIGILKTDSVNYIQLNRLFGQNRKNLMINL